MGDKRQSLTEVISSLESGMTLGIGGWGARRKPMAAVEAICRSELRDLEIVSFGGPDVGMLCASGKVKRVVCGFVTLDSVALDPHWRIARQEGRVELRELDEGMVYAGLQAAAWRIPFLPVRAGLGSDVLTHDAGLVTVRSPYDENGLVGEGGEELIAVPPLRLDAAIIHANRADSVGNAQFLGPDPYFDPLFLGAASGCRIVTAEQVVEKGTLTTFGPLSSIAIHRLMTDAIVEAPRGAGFTSCDPNYGRDEKGLREYLDSAKSPQAWDSYLAKLASKENNSHE